MPMNGPLRRYGPSKRPGLRPPKHAGREVTELPPGMPGRAHFQKDFPESRSVLEAPLEVFWNEACLDFQPFPNCLPGL